MHRAAGIARVATLAVLAPLGALGAWGVAGARAEEPPAASAAHVVASFQAPGAIAVGERALIRGRVGPAGRTEVVIQRHDGTDWRALVTLRTDRRGRFSASLPLRRSSRLRAAVRGAEGLVPGPRIRTIAIRRRARITVRVDAIELIAGRPIEVRGRVWPARPGERVLIEAQRGRRIVPLSRPRVKTGGRLRAIVRLPEGGRWRLRITAPGRRGHDAAGYAVTRTLAAYARNPHGVPRAAANYIVQDIGEMRLYYYESGALRRVLPVVFGAPGTPTPLGRFRVYSKTAGPAPAFGPLVLWYHRGYGIHGTNQEYLLGRSWRYYSHGCTRNYNANILWLWPRVPIGTPVVNLA